MRDDSDGTGTDGGTSIAWWQLAESEDEIGQRVERRYDSNIRYASHTTDELDDSFTQCRWYSPINVERACSPKREWRRGCGFGSGSRCQGLCATSKYGGKRSH
jgi:hypothetical protein